MPGFSALLLLLLNFFLAAAEQLLFLLPHPIQNLWWDLYFYVLYDVYRPWSEAMEEEPVETLFFLFSLIVLGLMLRQWMKNLWRENAIFEAGIQARVSAAPHAHPHEAGEGRLAHTPSPPPSPPSFSMPGTPPVVFTHFSGTGDSFAGLWHCEKFPAGASWEPTPSREPTTSPSIEKARAPQMPAATVPKVVKKSVSFAPTHEVGDGSTTRLPEVTQGSHLAGVVGRTTPAPVITLVVPPPATRPLPTPEQMLQVIIAMFAATENGLKMAMLAFLDALENGQPYGIYGESIHTTLRDAHQGLVPFFGERMAISASSQLGWNRMIFEFWGKLQPVGYELQVRFGPPMMAFCADVHAFAQYLGLDVPELNMAPPAPPQLPPQPPLSPRLPPAPVIHNPPSTSTFLVARQATSKPAQDVRPKDPRPVQEQPKTAGLTLEEQVNLTVGIDFNNLEQWSNLSSASLLRLDWASFGWSDKEAGNAKFWQFSTCGGLKIGGTTADWTNSAFVKQELTKTAAAFKRAAYVLRQQALTDGRFKYLADRDSKAFLMPEMQYFFEQAGEMTTACAGTNFVPEEFVQAANFFRDELLNGARVKRGLRDHTDQVTRDALFAPFVKIMDKWCR